MVNERRRQGTPQPCEPRPYTPSQLWPTMHRPNEPSWVVHSLACSPKEAVSHTIVPVVSLPEKNNSSHATDV